VWQARLNPLIEKLKLLGWGVARWLKWGQPDVSLGFLGGIGDDLLCTTAIEELLRRGAGRIWFFSRFPELYSHLDRRVSIIHEDARCRRLAERLGQPMRALSYSNFDEATDRDTACTEHLLVEMCRRAGLSGRIALRPYLRLTHAELTRASPYARCVVVQSGGLTAFVPMQNKQWPAERMQRVIDHFSERLRFVQTGSALDPPLAGALDLRGRTSPRETAAILAQARLFVGLVGFPMHLARAVDCPAVIVYGGREPPAISGYTCNLNLTRRPACSPCWQRNRCDHGRTCLEDIPAAEVIAAVDAALARPRSPLAVEERVL